MVVVTAQRALGGPKRELRRLWRELGGPWKQPGRFRRQLERPLKQLGGVLAGKE